MESPAASPEAPRPVCVAAGLVFLVPVMASAAPSPRPKGMGPSPGGRMRRWKRFSHEQIKSKIAQRRGLKNYHTLLMEAAVEKDERGVVFDSQHPSWAKLKDLVRTAGETRAERFCAELKRPEPNMHAIRQHCRRHGVPQALRGRVWMALLREAYRGPIPRCDLSRLLPENDPGLRVIRADISRTFPYLSTFQDKSNQKELEILLSAYCREFGVSYKQGMNFIFAIFYQIGLESREERYAGAAMFMGAVMGSVFRDADFSGLQAAFRVFRLLILYHDPGLCNYLDQYDMAPELYASPWFITLHANRAKLDVTLRLWDELLLELQGNALLHYFVSLALLVSHRDTLLGSGVVSLPERLSRLALSSREEVAGLVALARRRLCPDTPHTVHELLSDIGARINTAGSPLYRWLEAQHCVHVSASELVQNCYVDRTRHQVSPIKFFVLDCRPRSEYEAGHLACAYHLDPDLLYNPERLNATARSFGAMKGCHFCFCSDREAASPTRTDNSCTMFTLFLLQKGFKFVGRCKGGYQACHREVLARPGCELVDHNPEVCLECLRVAGDGKRAPSRGGRRLLNMLRTGLSDLLFGGVSASSSTPSPAGKHGAESTAVVPTSPDVSSPAKPAAPLLDIPAAMRSGRFTLLPPSPGLGVALDVLRQHKAYNAGLHAVLTHVATALVAHALASADTIPQTTTAASPSTTPRALLVALTPYDTEILKPSALAFGNLVRPSVAQCGLDADEKGKGFEIDGIPEAVPGACSVFIYASFGSQPSVVQAAVRAMRSRGAEKIRVLAVGLSRAVASAIFADQDAVFRGVSVVSATEIAGNSEPGDAARMELPLLRLRRLMLDGYGETRGSQATVD